MSPASRSSVDWRPSASLSTLRARAQALARIRAFFACRGVLEVETPILCASTATDPHLHSLRTTLGGVGGASRSLYLHTSPEFAMKRLLAAGAGPIYQLCKVFRDGESGRLHNPEFTLLEWYRPGYDHHALMDEVEALVDELLATGAAERRSYFDVFEQHTGLNPARATVDRLRACARDHGFHGSEALSQGDRDLYADFLMGHVVCPHLGHERPVFVSDFPATQAAMARIRPGDPPVAERFELFIKGIELANGYHELTDAAEQRARFVEDNRRRELALSPVVLPDERLLAALDQGLPACSGVALGVDRLMFLLVNATALSDVLSFPVQMA